MLGTTFRRGLLASTATVQRATVGSLSGCAVVLSSSRISSPATVSSPLCNRTNIGTIQPRRLAQSYNPTPQLPPEKLTIDIVEERVLKAIRSWDRFPVEKADQGLTNSLLVKQSERCEQIVNRMTVRWYGGKAPLNMKQAEDRVMLTLKLFDKIDPEKITLDSHFIKDLGLDSLDHVEIMVEIEDEFSFEIPEGDMERLMKPRDIIQYVCDHEDVYE